MGDTGLSDQASTMYDLDEDSLHEIVSRLDLGSMLALACTSRVWYEKLRTKANAWQLQWEPKGWSHHVVSDASLLSLTYETHDRHRLPWASASILPQGGRSAWRLRVVRSTCSKGDFYIGVCDACGNNAWAMFIGTGFLIRFYRNPDGNPVYGRAPPPSWPDGHGTLVMQPGLRDGKELGAVFEVIVDHHVGSLAFRLNGGPLLPALTGFPKGTQLRPFARMCHEGDQMQFV